MSASPGASPATRPTFLEEGRVRSEPASLESDTDGASLGHVKLTAPQRPDLLKRNTIRGESVKSVSEALRLARSREEQETLLGDNEQADDDGCYPPRKNDDPRAPNPHSSLPIYITIHKIRRLIIAAIGRSYCYGGCKSR
jgi:hypothetical protein